MALSREIRKNRAAIQDMKLRKRITVTINDFRLIYCWGKTEMTVRLV